MGIQESIYLSDIIIELYIDHADIVVDITQLNLHIICDSCVSL